MTNWFQRLFRPAQYEKAIREQTELELRSSGTVFAPVEMYGHTPSAGVNVNETTAIGISALHRALDILSGTFNKLDQRIVQTSSSGTKKVLQDHRLVYPLNYEPNQLYNAKALWGYVVWQCALHGNGLAWIKERYPLRLYGISAQHTVLRYMDNKWVYQTVIYEDREGNVVPGVLNTAQIAVAGARALTVYIPLSEMFHLKHSVNNMLVGFSLLDRLRTVLGEQIALQDYGAAFFENGAQLKTIMEMQGFNPNDAENVKRYRRLVETQHKGVHNNARIGLVPPGSKVYNLGLNNEQIQWLQARMELSPMLASQLTGVPGYKLGAEQNTSQYKNISERDQSFLDDTMASYFDRFSAEVHVKLLSEDEKRSGNICHEFNREKLIAHDIATLDKINQDKLLSGRMTINEYLASCNKPGIGEDGDERFIPTNVKPLTQLLEPPPPPQPPTQPGTVLADGKQPLDKAKEATAKRVMTRIRKSVESRSKRADFHAWLSYEFRNYHRDIVIEQLAPLTTDADVIADTLLTDLQEELAAVLKEDWDFTRYEQRLYDDLRN